jgi:hypothetical protein
VSGNQFGSGLGGDNPLDTELKSGSEVVIDGPGGPVAPPPPLAESLGAAGTKAAPDPLEE